MEVVALTRCELLRTSVCLAVAGALARFAETSTQAAQAASAGQEARLQPLRELAEVAGLDLGVSLTLVHVPGILDLMAREFNLGRITYDLRWDNIEPIRGELQFRNVARYSDAERKIKKSICLRGLERG